jgi:nicotinamidase-related amidase
MPVKNRDLHGSAPDKSEIALLLIDVINDLDFPEADDLLPYARPMARKIVRLKQRAKQAGVPVIYVNDNFGRWRSDFRRQVVHCLRDNSRGHQIVSLLQPEEDDYFVLKPKHSGFFSTTLETLLRYLGSRKLVLTGIAGNFCVLFTANDAYMRDYDLIVPSDCTASNTAEENRQALALMRKFLKADTRPSTKVRFPRARTRKRRR